ncbi:MarR family winged helix-turn-helix transcriptional regulator [Streptomyces sindenensis]|uniref:MarR family winged helix-turn-helix transcriptional regulator n=1 Tax=Streptomyces sindenensis TaxID=67363 RepID=A0ABW6EQT8_9ACTN|nr:MarR family transcriptional regulator [Streptomyces sindenensis]GGP82390.1 MarR family transcriptional regulator [Streptomyces sindenensis]
MGETGTRTRDAVDDFLDQWAALRSDLDLEAMGAVGRLLRLTRLVEKEVGRYFAEHGMERWEFDVLATLRRSDRPLTPKELAGSVMVSSAALTNRIDRLAARNLVARETVPGDRRSLHITLTDAGRALVDDTVEGHVRNERRMLARLDEKDCDELNRLLRMLLTTMEGDA